MPARKRQENESSGQEAGIVYSSGQDCIQKKTKSVLRFASFAAELTNYDRQESSDGDEPENDAEAAVEFRADLGTTAYGKLGWLCSAASPSPAMHTPMHERPGLQGAATGDQSSAV